MPNSSQSVDMMLATARRAVVRAARVCRFVQARLDEMRAMTKDDRSPVTIADYASQAVVARSLQEAGLIGTAGMGGAGLVAEEAAEFLRQPGHEAHLAATLAALRASGAWEAGEGGLDGGDAQAVLEAIDLGGHEPTPGAPEGYWTLDPIDGTKGFLRGPVGEGKEGEGGGQYAIALAYIEDGRVKLGVLGCPNLALDPAEVGGIDDPRGCVLWCVRDGDARSPVFAQRLDGDEHARTVSPRFHRDKHLERVRVAESVESGHTSHSASARLFEEAGVATDGIRLDSQCKYAVCALGAADVYVRLPTKKGYVERIWDHAAGAIIAQEAGLIVSDVDGKPLDFAHGKGLAGNRGVIVAPPRLHERLIEAARIVGI